MGVRISTMWAHVAMDTWAHMALAHGVETNDLSEIMLGSWFMWPWLIMQNVRARAHKALAHRAVAQDPAQPAQGSTTIEAWPHSRISKLWIVNLHEQSCS